jgi:hypothetical protein
MTFTQEIKIGDKFFKKTSKSKKDIFEVKEILTTTNSKGEIVRITVIAKSTLAGFPFTAELPATTVIMNRLNS